MNGISFPCPLCGSVFEHSCIWSQHECIPAFESLRYYNDTRKLTLRYTAVFGWRVEQRNKVIDRLSFTEAKRLVDEEGFRPVMRP